MDEAASRTSDQDPVADTDAVRLPQGTVKSLEETEAEEDPGTKGGGALPEYEDD